MKTMFTIILALTWGATTLAAMHTETVEYKQGTTVCEGYLAYDDAVQGRRPAVLVIHQWTGLNDYVRSRCQQLAKLGYIAFGADIYGKGVRPQTPDEAGKEAGKYRGDRALLRTRANAALRALRGNPLTDTARIAAIGYCFGGGTVLELARSGANLAGVVSFHGFLNTPNPADAKNIKCRVLVCHGGDDPYESAEEVAAFQDEMRKASVDWQFDIYGGAVHAFTDPSAGGDPSKGAAYNERADKRSWEAMKTFFAEIFK
jgi:dienelactone hydrolase